MGRASSVVQGLACLLVCCAASVVEARDLVLAEAQAPGHVIVQSEERMASRLADLSKGTLQIQLKHSGQLCNESQCWEKIKAGTLDIARVNLGVLSQDLPAVKIASLPYLFRTREHMWHVLAGDFGKRIDAEASKKGAIVLAYYDSGTRSFYTSKHSIHSVADFSGLRIRVQDSPVYTDLIRALGAVPVVLPYDKVTDALKSGEIDAAENNTSSYVSSGHYKYAKYYSMDEHSSVPEVLLISKKAWASLIPVQQKALMDAAVESSEYMKQLWAESEVQALAKAKKEGVIVTEKSRISMTGIEGYAVKLYTKYITDGADLDTVLAIQSTK